MGLTVRLDHLAVDVLTVCVLLLNILEVVSVRVSQCVWGPALCVAGLVLLLTMRGQRRHIRTSPFTSDPINNTCRSNNTWFCVDVECRPEAGAGVMRKSSSSSSSMSQASLVLRANSWKLEAFLDLRLLNLGFVSLGYLQEDRCRGQKSSTVAALRATRQQTLGDEITKTIIKPNSKSKIRQFNTITLPNRLSYADINTGTVHACKPHMFKSSKPWAAKAEKGRVTDQIQPHGRQDAMHAEHSRASQSWVEGRVLCSVNWLYTVGDDVKCCHLCADKHVQLPSLWHRKSQRQTFKKVYYSHMSSSSCVFLNKMLSVNWSVSL